MYDFSFICRPCKSDKKGVAPIELSINIDGKRTFVALPFKTDPTKFKKMRYATRNNEVKDYIAAITTKLNKCVAEMACKNIAITASALKDYFKNGGVKSFTLSMLQSDFIKYYTKKSEVNAVTTNVVRKYELALQRFSQFIEKDVEITEVTSQHIEDFRIEIARQMKPSSVAHTLQKIKTVFTYAEKLNKLDINPFFDITIGKPQNDVEFLTIEEFERIKNKDFKNERLNKVRDLFLFQCETATAFTDMQQITFCDIQQENGKFYIKKKRQKTGVEFFTVLTPLAMQILKKYNYSLDIMSNQKCNAYLKEIADLCKITKPLHTHIARHTAATRMLNNDMRIEVVAKVLGHTNLRQTQHYAKLIDKTVLNEFDKMVAI